MDLIKKVLSNEKRPWRFATTAGVEKQAAPNCQDNHRKEKHKKRKAVLAAREFALVSESNVAVGHDIRLYELKEKALN